MNEQAVDGLEEHPLVLACEGEQLVAVLTQPSTRPARSGLVLVTGGPQYRAGAHRQFVQLARGLARQGHLVLRFDARGMGDSTGTHTGFENLGADIGAAVQAARQRLPAGAALALWGLCDGASAAALYLARQGAPGVDGLALLNPWVRSEATLAQTRVKFWYLQRLRQADFWRKLLRGGIGPSALRGLLQNLRLAARKAGPAQDFRVGMLQGLARCPSPALVHISDGDTTGLEFKTHAGQDNGWQRLAAAGQWRMCTLQKADHTLTTEAARQQLAQDLHAFLCDLKPAGAVS
jgi:exosortase A-associated hydrolase 1